MYNFSDVKISRTLTNILNESNISQLTKIQYETVKAFKNDLIVQSPTGTGKTLAYLIPIAENYHKTKISTIFAVILVPTRELAKQVSDVLFSLKVNNTIIIGGSETEEKFEPVVIATPGRFNQVLLNGNLIIVGEKKNTLSQILKKLDFLILDEADKLLSLGFRNQLLSITRHVKSKRNALFSATFNDNISALCKSFLKSPKYIQNTEKIQLDIKFIRTTPFMKIFHLLRIIQKHSRVIVFFLTCNEVDYFTDLFKSLGFDDIVKIHGKMEQAERNIVYSNFKNILFGTDLASRGIDFKNVDIVVHFDIPLDPDTFLHRSGRSARNCQKGKALIFLTQNERRYQNYLKIRDIDIDEDDQRIESVECNEIISKLQNRIKQEHLIDHQSENNKMNEYSDQSNCKNINEEIQAEELIFAKLQKNIECEILTLSVKAFVSHIAAYKEHTLKYLLDFKELDFDSLARLHFLVKIPKMRELTGVKFKNFEKVKKEIKQII